MKWLIQIAVLTIVITCIGVLALMVFVYSCKVKKPFAPAPFDSAQGTVVDFGDDDEEDEMWWPKGFAEEVGEID